MAFRYPQKVLFKHCDPAGIVFYPRYFEMMNDCVEAFFAEAVGVPFEALHPAHAVPTAQIETQFHAPSRHGDHLDLILRLTHIGGSALGYGMQAKCAGALRFTATATLVHVGPDGRPERWPETMRQRFKTIVEGQECP